MDFTFGVCVTSHNKDYHDMIIDSIEQLNIPNYEILFIGVEDCENDRVKLLDFDESVKKGWITRKKNLLCQNAKFENVVLLHDYVAFNALWYEGFLKFGNDWEAAMNVILNSDGNRFRDWCLNPYDVIPPEGPIANREFLLPYEETKLNSKMYFSGAYWVAKTKFMLSHPLDEKLGWAESEDMEWSNRAREDTQFVMNPFSIVYFLKNKYDDFTHITQENLEKVRPA